MSRFRTQGFNPYAVKFSPYVPDKIAVASAANFGLVGNGRLYILTHTLQPLKTFDTQDGLFDLSWAENHESLLVTASGDGSVKLFDINMADFPIQVWHEHQREVFSTHWNQISKDTFISSSWDGSIKLYTPQRNTSLSTFYAVSPPGPQQKQNCIYSAKFSPHDPYTFCSGSADSMLRTWDIRNSSPVTTIPAHPGAEILSVDWNKYRPMTVLTAGSLDKSIREWDLRNFSQPLNTYQGHSYAVRNVQASPWSDSMFASASYDMTIRIWDSKLPQQQFAIMGHHTEFCIGLDWSLHEENLLATCAWDELVCIFPVRPGGR